MGGCLCDAESSVLLCRMTLSSAPHRQCLRIQENYFLYTYANKSQNVSLYPNTNTHTHSDTNESVCARVYVLGARVL